MAVAVKNSPDTVRGRELNRFAVGSWAAVVYVLATVAVIFYGVSWLANAASPSLTSAGLSAAVQTTFWLVVRIVGLAALVYFGMNLVGNQPSNGLAAGTTIAVAAMILIGLLTCFVGRGFENWFGERSSAAIMLTLLLGVGLLAGLVYLYFQPRFEQRVIQIQGQGWFTIAPYKKTQGQRVRRGTILGFLVLAGCGIWTLMHSNALPAGDLRIVLPFTGGSAVTLLPNARFSVPLLLAAVAFWLSYRIVNYPTFADFLIATEAELNKVSWTTRKRLIQDTIVVLVTVVLLTVFLFVVDQIWAWILTKIGIIQIAPPSGGEGGAKVPY